MSPHRITKKEIKQDKFVTYALKLSEWIQKHLNEVIIGVGGMVLVAVIIFFVLSTKAKRERKAFELMGKANLELQAGNLGGAITDLQTLVNNFSSTKSAGKATFLLASAYFYAKDYVQAQAMFERYLQKHKEDPLLASSAQAGIGDCHLQTKDFAQAGDDFLKAVSLNPRGFLAPQYLLKAAYACLKADQKDKAKEILEKLIREYPGSKEMQKAKIQLAENLG